MSIRNINLITILIGFIIILVAVFSPTVKDDGAGFLGFGGFCITILGIYSANNCG